MSKSVKRPRRCPFHRERSIVEWVAITSEESSTIKYAMHCLTCHTRGPIADSRTEAQDLWDNR